MIAMTSLADLVIGITLAECLLLAAWRGRRSAGIGLRELGLNIASGLCLMLALRCLAADAGAAWVAAWLAAAGIAHVSDLVIRWRRGRAGDRPTEGAIA